LAKLDVIKEFIQNVLHTIITISQKNLYFNFVDFL